MVAGKRKAVVLLLATVAALWLALGIVPVPKLLEPASGSRALFASRGEFVSLSLAPDEKYRLFTDLAGISPDLLRATLLYEDKYFFYHPGVNPYSLVRGAVLSAISPSRPIGGSTLTMQLARLRFGLNTRSITGKIQQIFWAFVLERHFSKKQILEAYLNLAPYGANIEGVGAASLIYFHRRAKEIATPEAITLAVLPQHPSLRWRTQGKKSLELARTELSERWAADTGEARPLGRDFIFSPASVPAGAPHFFNKIRALQPELIEFHSTLDETLQHETEEVLQSTLDRFSEFGVRNGTILLAELPDLRVRAYVGSAEYLSEDISGYVNGLAGERSPGSLLKPFIYGLALDQGEIAPETMLADVPIRLASYTPENFERNFLGPISATNALIRSRNIPALQVFRALSPGSFYHFLGSGGVGRLKSEEYYGIALVLGGLGITSEEVAQLYAVLGNQGEYRTLQYFSAEAHSEHGQKLLTPEAAYLVLDMLSKNPPALGRFREKHIPWKTGTSYGSRDAWAAGIVGPYVAVVWLGNFDGKPNPNLVGRDFAGPVFFSVADRLLSSGVLPSQPYVRNLNLKKVQVCALSGAIAGPDCPHKKQSWFIPGVSPIQACNIHKRVRINPVGGLRLCPGELGGEERVYEVWDSSMQQLFQRAGLRRNMPPAYESRCGLATNTNDRLRIVSPEEYVEYYLEPHRDLELELRAAVPGDAKQVSWFVDDVFLITTAPSESSTWKAQIGHFDIRAVDDRGRSAVTHIKVLPQIGVQEVKQASNR